MVASQHCEVIVIGAGPSGLDAARRLSACGVDVLCVEARERVGGRTRGLLHDGVCIDVGTHRIGAMQPRLEELAALLGLELVGRPRVGRHVSELCGRRAVSPRGLPAGSLTSSLLADLAIRRIEAMAGRVPVAEPWRAAQAGAWDATTLEEALRRLTSAGRSRALLEVAIGASFGRPSADISLLFFLFALNSAGGFRQLFGLDEGLAGRRLLLGAEALSQRMAAELEDAVLLGWPVRALEQDEGGVRVHGDHGTIRADFAVVALPPHLTRALRYEPELPASRAQLLDRWSMGTVVSVLAIFREPVWRQSDLSGFAVSDVGPLSWVDDHGGVSDGAALSGLVLGSAARRWRERPPSSRRAAVVEQLERLFGVPPSALVAYHERDWQAEPGCGGGPSAALPPGVLGNARAGLRAPFGRIHWAGAETARNWNGRLEGALEAGDLAAAEILARISDSP